MRIYKVTDINKAIAKETTYDVSIFVSGYEKRCTYIPQNLIKKENSKETIIFGYQEGRRLHFRSANDKYFQNYWAQITHAGENDDTAIYEKLRQIKLNSKENNILRILVDYSTMSRLWYSSILNWARFLTDFQFIEIDFLYSFGRYQNEFSPFVIESILALPGYEGAPIFDAQTVAIFGLGFDGLLVLGAFDQLEPNIAYGYLASPGAYGEYPHKAKECNKVFILNHAKNILELPISSIEATFSSLTELISPHRGKDNIVIIPLGPKPHVLAAILLCMRFEKDVSCLRIRGKREPRVDVKAEGHIVATRVSFRQDL